MTNALYAAPAQTVANAKAMRLSGYRLLKISRAVGDMSGAAAEVPAVGEGKSVTLARVNVSLPI